MFRNEKALEAASYLLERIPEGPKTEYTKLVKLMYLADRALMEAKGRTITGDHMNALKNGPILSLTLNLLKGDAEGWENHIRKASRYVVELVKATPPAALSRADITALDVVLKEHGHKTWEELIEFTHTLPEWIDKKIAGNRNWAIIHLSDLAEALGYDQDEVEVIEAHERDRRENTELMQTLGVKSA